MFNHGEKPSKGIEKPNIKSEILLRASEFGSENEEAEKLLLQWMNERENTLEDGNIEKRIIYELERAELFLKIGRIDDAYESCNDAMDSAQQAGIRELFEKGNDLLERIHNLE